MTINKYSIVPPHAALISDENYISIYNHFYCYRTLSFIKKYYNGEIPKFVGSEQDEEMIAQVAKELKDYIKVMECVR